MSEDIIKDENNAQKPSVKIEAAAPDGNKSKNRPAKEKSKEQGKSSPKLGVWFKEIRAEAGKIIWPNRKELVKMTFTVIVTSLAFGALIAGMDVVFRYAVGFLVQLM